MKKAISIMLITVTVLIFSACSGGKKETKAAATAEATEKCIVSGESLEKSSITVTVNGKEAKLCCMDCLESLKKDPAKYGY